MYQCTFWNYVDIIRVVEWSHQLELEHIIYTGTFHLKSFSWSQINPENYMATFCSNRKNKIIFAERPGKKTSFALKAKRRQEKLRVHGDTGNVGWVKSSVRFGLWLNWNQWKLEIKIQSLSLYILWLHFHGLKRHNILSFWLRKWKIYCVHQSLLIILFLSLILTYTNIFHKSVVFTVTIEDSWKTKFKHPYVENFPNMISKTGVAGKCAAASWKQWKVISFSGSYLLRKYFGKNWL